MLTVIRSAVVASSLRCRQETLAAYSKARDQMIDHYRRHSTQGSEQGHAGTNNETETSSTDLLSTGKSRPAIDRSKVPVIDEKDIDEMFVSGHGPGGQSVNKSVNACQLRHRPTGIVIKVHQSRSLEQNRQIARELLAQRLDNLYNGDASVQSQKKRLALQRIATRDNLSDKRRVLKEQYKKRLSERKSSDDEH